MPKTRPESTLAGVFATVYVSDTPSPIRGLCEALIANCMETSPDSSGLGGATTGVGANKQARLSLDTNTPASYAGGMKYDNETTKTTLLMPKKLWHEVRLRAQNDGRSAREIVIEALEAFLKKGSRKY
jgi:hypothetical protein